MAENEKRIAIRLDPKTWQKYDDLRHAQRLSFQQLGEMLLARWLDQSTSKGQENHQEKLHKKLIDSSSGNPEVVLDSSNQRPQSTRSTKIQPADLEEFEPWVSQLCHVLRQNNTFAAKAIKENIRAFVRLTDLDDGGLNAPPPADPDQKGPLDTLRDETRKLGDIARDLESRLDKRRRRA